MGTMTGRGEELLKRLRVGSGSEAIHTPASLAGKGAGPRP